METQELNKIIENISWYGSASIKLILGNKTVLIDPVKLTDTISADYILITHIHGDHLSPTDIKKCMRQETKVFAPQCAMQILQEIECINLQIVNIGTVYKLGDIELNILPAYNTSEAKQNFHPKSKGFVGYQLKYKNIKIYHPGDTEITAEMKDNPCDIAFMPLGQTYTMNSVEEAVTAITTLKAIYAIPIHFGRKSAEGTMEDAQKFKKLLEGKTVVIIKDAL